MAAPSLSDITRATATVFGVRHEVLFEGRKLKVNSRLRWIAVHTARRLTTKSYPVIASYMGYGDHTTAIHGVKRISAMATPGSLIRQSLASVEALATSYARDRASVDAANVQRLRDGVVSWP